MSYTIRYSPESRKRYPAGRSHKYNLRMGVLILMLVLLGFAVHYRAHLFRFLLPGDPDVTAVALQDLVQDIRTGKSDEAFSIFCREIISHAQG